MKRLVLPLLAAPFALAACSDPAPAPSDPATSAAVVKPAPSQSMVPPVGASADGTDVAAQGATFPSAMRGRWGLVANDCDPTRGDNKGIMTIGENDVRFYESVAEIGKVADRSDRSLRAMFDYEGEGMAWLRDARYELADGGRTLVLTEFGDDAPQGPRRYSRCK